MFFIVFKGLMVLKGFYCFDMFLYVFTQFFIGFIRFYLVLYRFDMVYIKILDFLPTHPVRAGGVQDASFDHPIIQSSSRHHPDIV